MTEGKKNAEGEPRVSSRVNPEAKISDLTVEQLMQLLGGAGSAEFSSMETSEGGGAIDPETKTADLKLGEFLRLISTAGAPGLGLEDPGNYGNIATEDDSEFDELESFSGFEQDDELSEPMEEEWGDSDTMFESPGSYGEPY